MIFAHPQWLYGLALLPVLFGFAFWRVSRMRRQFESFAHHGLWSRIMPEFSPRRRLTKLALWAVAYAFILLALARPQWGEREETVQSNGLDVMVLLDVSNSMNTEDVVPSRLKRAKRFIRNLADRIRGDRMGLAVFAGSTYLVTPLTTDIGYVLETLETVGPQTVTRQGTDIGIALAEASRAMERGGEQSDATKIIVLISDGEDLEERALAGAQELAANRTILYAFGVGTEKGGPVPVRDPQGVLRGYKRDKSGQPVISTFQSRALAQLASTANGRYWNLSADETEIDEFAEEIGVQGRKERGERVIRVKQEQYQVPLAIAILILFFELAIPLHRARAVVLLALAVASGSAFAIEPTGLNSYFQNRKGLQELQAQNPAEAEQAFRSAQGKDPGHPTLQYNLGTSLALQKGQTSLPQAQEELRQSVERSEAIGDRETSARALYNMAEIQKSLGDTNGSTRSLLTALDHAQMIKDQTLEGEIRKKLEEVAEKQDQQQKQDQKKSEENQKQDQQKPEQNQSQEGSQGNQKKDQPQDNGKSQPNPQDGEKPKDQSQTKPQKFQSRTLTKEDAERVMNELSEREKELQAKQRRERGGPGGGNDKDW